MGRKYFGTDGVRGRVGEEPMTVEFALRLASAVARVLAPNGGTALVGKDTRVSGYMFEAALEAGFVAAGVDVSLIGPLPTPGIALLTQRFGCSFGVVISASHNPFEDNGIKFFDSMGSKLSDELEEQIEGFLDGPALTRDSTGLGKATRVDKSRVVYQEFCASTMPPGVNLEGLGINDLLHPIPLGIMLGLFVGKQAGVFAFAWAAVKLGIARLPSGVKFTHVYGAAVLCGIGFTMSLLIGMLAFENAGGGEVILTDRLGILVGSLVSAVVGYVVLHFTLPRPRSTNP